MSLKPRTKLRKKAVLLKLIENDWNYKKIAEALEVDAHQVNYCWGAGFHEADIMTICDLFDCVKEELL